MHTGGECRQLSEFALRGSDMTGASCTPLLKGGITPTATMNNGNAGVLWIVLILLIKNFDIHI